MKFEEIEALAQGILKDAGINSFPIPVEAIASKFQIKISRGPSPDFSGILIRKDEYSLIGVNDTEPSCRQRFTIAHELGHYFLHESKDTFIDYRDNKKTSPQVPKEREADMFAAALLMPRSLMEVDFKSVISGGLSENDIEKMALRCNVSEKAMQLRLLNLRLA